MSAALSDIVLASASPRRRELLDRWGIDYRVVTSGVDESFEPDWSPERLVKELARRKALAVAANLPAGIVIGADTTVVIDDLVLNKPEDEADARRMLGLLRGRAHEVWTGVALIGSGGGRDEAAAVRSIVRMRDYSNAEIDAYVATGEPLDKAGAYAIQGGAGVFVAGIEGCYANVVGLPLCELGSLLARVGVRPKPGEPRCLNAAGEPCPRLPGERS